MSDATDEGAASWADAMAECNCPDPDKHTRSDCPFVVEAIRLHDEEHGRLPDPRAEALAEALRRISQGDVPGRGDWGEDAMSFARATLTAYDEGETK